MTHYGIAALDGLGSFSRAELSAAGALIAYLELTQKGKQRARSRGLPRVAPSHFMAIDAATRRNLELTETFPARAAAACLSVIDRTVTAAGARELASRLAAPLTDVKAIEARHDLGGVVRRRQRACAGALRDALRSAPDISRALARLSVGRGGPRDLANLRDGVAAARALREGLSRDQACRAKPRSRADAITDSIAAVSRLCRPAGIAAGGRAALSRPRWRLHKNQCPCAAG